jgi:hypothetical protein
VLQRSCVTATLVVACSLEVSSRVDSAGSVTRLDTQELLARNENDNEIPGPSEADSRRQALADALVHFSLNEKAVTDGSVPLQEMHYMAICSWQLAVNSRTLNAAQTNHYWSVRVFRVPGSTRFYTEFFLATLG